MDNTSEKGSKTRMALITGSHTPTAFADDPIASHSAQFGLARPTDTPVGQSTPSPVGVRPWNLRGAQPLGRSGTSTVWRYDYQLQIAVTADGLPFTEIIDATAESVSDLDGDEGSSEDWKYDFHPDEPGSPA